MFTSLFVKKKISHKEIAQKFVHHTLQTIDDTYSDFLDAIFYDPELTEHPPLDYKDCLLYTSPSPRDLLKSRMPSSA